MVLIVQSLSGMKFVYLVISLVKSMLDSCQKYALWRLCYVFDQLSFSQCSVFAESRNGRTHMRKSFRVGH